VAHAGGQQQRRRPGPAGRHGPLGQLLDLGAQLGGGHRIAVVVGGPAQLLEGGRLQLLEAVLDGQRERSLLVGEGGLVAAEGDKDPAPVEAGARLQRRVAGPVEQPLGVAVGVRPGGVGGRRHPGRGRGRGRPVFGGGGVAGGRLPPVGQPAGQATVAGAPGRPRAGLVEDLADQVVGELVAGAGSSSTSRRAARARSARAAATSTGSSRRAATTSRSTAAPATTAARNRFSTSGPARRARARTASRSDAGIPAWSWPASAAARSASTVTGCGPWPAPAPGRPARPRRTGGPARPPRPPAAGPAPAPARCRPACSGPRPPPRPGRWPPPAHGRRPGGAAGNAAAQGWTRPPGGGRRPPAAAAAGRPARARSW